MQDPAAPFGEERGSALQRLIDAWKDHIGDSLPLPPKVTTEVAQRVRLSGVPVDLFTKLLRDSTRKSLLSQARFTFQRATISNREEILLAFQPPRPKGWETLWLHLPFAVQATNYLLPARHQVRQALSGLIDDVREFLQTESVVLPVGGPFLHTSEEDAEGNAAMSRLVALIGPGETRRGMTRFDNGTLIQAALLRASHDCRAAGRPSLANQLLRIVEGIRRLRAMSDHADSETLRRDVRAALETASELRRNDRVPIWVAGITRRIFEPADCSKLAGWFAEPVLARSGYTGICVYFLDDDHYVYHLSEVKPSEAG